MAWLASPRFPGDARLRHDGRSDIALIRHRPKKRNVGPRQKPRHSHADIDPLVNSGNPPHRHQTRAKPYPTRTYRRMVTLAQSSPSCRSASALQSKTATVMLEQGAKWLQKAAEQGHIAAQCFPATKSDHTSMTSLRFFSRA